MTTDVQDFTPPHGMSLKAWRRVQDAFEHGGIVTANQADAYMGDAIGTMKRRCLANEIPHRAKAHGELTIYQVHTRDVMRACGPIGGLGR